MQAKAQEVFEACGNAASRAAGFYAAWRTARVDGWKPASPDGASELYEDFSRTYIAGRFGEASTHLFMLDQQYVSRDHLPSLVLRGAQESSPSSIQST